MSDNDVSEIAPLTDAARRAWPELVERAMLLVNESPAGRELAWSGFAEALARGEARVEMRVALPSGRIVALGAWPARSDELLRLFELVPSVPRGH